MRGLLTFGLFVLLYTQSGAVVPTPETLDVELCRVPCMRCSLIPHHLLSCETRHPESSSAGGKS